MMHGGSSNRVHARVVNRGLLMLLFAGGRFISLLAAAGGLVRIVHSLLPVSAVQRWCGVSVSNDLAAPMRRLVDTLLQVQAWLVRYVNTGPSGTDVDCVVVRLK